jgi:hypothetical protein
LSSDLHIHVRQDAEDVTDITDNFPYEQGQTIIAQSRELIIIDLGDADDTSYVQEWYLNGHEAVSSFYIVDDDPSTNTIFPEE